MRGLIEQELTEKTEEIAVLVTSALFVHKESAVHPLYSQSSAMTSDVIGAAIDVHRDKGPGLLKSIYDLLESIYEWCLTMELELRGHHGQTQKKVTVRYKQFSREEPLRFDLLIDRCLLVEVKAVDKILPISKAQLLSYRKLLDVPLGLLINFNTSKLADGVSRLILPAANLDKD